LPETSIAVQKPSLKQVLLYRSQAWKHALTSNLAKQDSKLFQPIRTLHSINGSWSQSRKSWRKDVISLDKAVNGARQPNAIKSQSNIRINQW